MIPLATPFHKKVIWEGVKPNRRYLLTVVLHRKAKGGGSSATLPSSSIEIKAQLQ
jgi:hypothetical protein